MLMASSNYSLAPFSVNRVQEGCVGWGEEPPLELIIHLRIFNGIGASSKTPMRAMFEPTSD